MGLTPFWEVETDAQGGVRSLAPHLTPNLRTPTCQRQASSSGISRWDLCPYISHLWVPGKI